MQSRCYPMSTGPNTRTNTHTHKHTHAHAGTVLSTGPLYQVREGDYLDALSQRFLVPVDNLLRSNPDVALGGSALTPGLQMCVRTPVCGVKCKYGTECHLPETSPR